MLDLRSGAGEGTRTPTAIIASRLQIGCVYRFRHSRINARGARVVCHSVSRSPPCHALAVAPRCLLSPSALWWPPAANNQHFGRCLLSRQLPNAEHEREIMLRTLFCPKNKKPHRPITALSPNSARWVLGHGRPQRGRHTATKCLVHTSTEALQRQQNCCLKAEKRVL